MRVAHTMILILDAETYSHGVKSLKSSSKREDIVFWDFDHLTFFNVFSNFIVAIFADILRQI